MRAAATGHDETFLVGTAISTFQCTGDVPEGNWHRWQRRKHFGIIPTIFSGDRAEEGPDFWHRYEEDLELNRQLGANCFRFSFQWSRIEPRPGEFDEEALGVYDKMLRCMEAKGQIPHATLWHYTHPSWFEDLGGFEKEENLPYFIRYASFVFERFHRYIQLWTTFNEPIVCLLGGYLAGLLPPGRLFALKSIGLVYANILKTHAECYRALKAMPGGSTARVGFVHNYVTFRARSEWYLHARALASFATNLWANQPLIDFFRTGRFEFHSGVPWTGTVLDLGAAPGLDFLGINFFYSRGVFGLFCQPTGMPGDEMTEMPYAMYPEGLYECIRHLSTVGVPLVVSENGISDSKDTVRPRWIEGYAAQVERAIQDGYDVRGYLYWTLYDNFEWQFGFTQRCWRVRAAQGSVADPAGRSGMAVAPWCPAGLGSSDGTAKRGTASSARAPRSSVRGYGGCRRRTSVRGRRAARNPPRPQAGPRATPSW